jgi:hypothetical protein
MKLRGVSYIYPLYIWLGLFEREYNAETGIEKENVVEKFTCMPVKKGRDLPRVF